MPISKREFIRRVAFGTCGLMCAGFIPAMGAEKRELWKWSREAYYYAETPRGVMCTLCPNECVLRPGEESDCHNRVNHNGKLYTIAYGNPCAVHIDPIEKKPLLHFLPESHALSIATAGCNFACLNCQNWNISQSSPHDTRNADLMPEKVVEASLGNRCASIAYTYGEPISFYEYMFDTAKRAHGENVKNVMVSNGYINRKPLENLAPYIDAANIDLKAFDDSLYLKLTGGSLQPVLGTLKTLKEFGVWIEITNLVVPSWTDDLDMIRRMCQWLVKNGFENYPLHFSRFHPQYKLTQLPSTPLNTLIQARAIAEAEGCNYVYIGNVPGKGYENTRCPSCRQIVVERRGFAVLSNHIKNGKCSFCGADVHGVWK